MQEIGYKEKIIRNNNNNHKKLVLIFSGAYTPFTGVGTPILTAAPLWYFSCYLSLAFFEGHCPSLSLAVIFLCLDPVTWDSSAPSKRVAFFSSTSSWSHWRYSNVLFFFFFSSAILYLLAFSLAFFSTSFLAFWAMCSAQHNFTASSSWSRSYCYSLCLHCISRISVLFCEILEGVGEDMIIQKQEQKTFFSVYVLLI